MRVLLFSGGIESTCLAYHLRPDVCLTINYGQVSARGEIAASRLVAGVLRLSHEIIEIDAADLGSGLLAGRKNRFGLPEFWPFRNQLLISLAAMRFFSSADVYLFVGTVRSDSKHLDGALPFLRMMRKLLLYQKSDLVLEYPFARLSTESLLRSTQVPNELLGYTFSCHTGSLVCGRCPGCLKNLEARDYAISLSRTGDGPTKPVQPKKLLSSKILGESG